MGNSHTSLHDVPGAVGAMLRATSASDPEVVTAPGSMFLDERLTDPATLELLRTRTWDVVVLQAQKYSASGRFHYSTSEAIELIGLVRESGAVPVLFPEWSRRDVAETQRILALHESIAASAPACIAPVPQVFDRVHDQLPALVLHEPDGNHASASGALLAAMVIYGTITGRSPAVLPQVRPEVPAAVQRDLATVAAREMNRMSPWRTCPKDRPSSSEHASTP